MMKRDLPYELCAWCLVILVAAFMPWAASAVSLPFFGSVGSAAATGWTGSINFLFILIPNWLGVVLAAGIAAIAWLRIKGVELKPELSYRLALAGTIHAGVFIVWVVFGGWPPALGLGSIGTLAAFIAIVRLLKKNAELPNSSVEANPPLVD
jgi:hypothetical protein